MYPPRNCSWSIAYLERSVVDVVLYVTQNRSHDMHAFQARDVR